MSNEFLFAIDELTQPALLRREYPDVRNDQVTQVVENFTGPSLLDELIDAIEPGTGNTDRSGFGSRPLIDTGALDLWVEISYDVHYWARELKINRRNYPDKDGVALLLRAVAVTAPRRWGDDQTHEAARLCRQWARKIRTMLHNSRTWRGVRGVPCEHCGVLWVLEKRYEDDTEQTFREPALIAHSMDGKIKYWMCRACQKTAWPEERVAS